MSKKNLWLFIFTLVLSLGLASVAMAADQADKGEPPNHTDGGSLWGNGVETKDSQPSPEAAWAGPDGYGYVGDYTASNWIDISASGTSVLSLTDDSFAGPFPIGFDFNFYGSVWSEYFISSNGFLSFGFGSNTFSNQCPLPTVTSPNNIIAPMWDDLYPNYTIGGVYYQSFNSCPIGEGACLVVEYLNWAHCCDVNNIAGTFETILYEDGSIIMLYQDAGSQQGSSSTTGIENTNAGSDWGLTYACNTADTLVDGLAIRFEQPPAFGESTVEAPVKLAPGDIYTYTITLNNTLPMSATDVIMTDTLPVGVTYVDGSVQCSSGECWYDQAADAVYWNGDLAYHGSRFFVTNVSGDNTVYEVDLIKSRVWWTPSSWGILRTCSIPDIIDTAGIDYDVQHGWLYHSDLASNNIVVTDLSCNVIGGFSCDGGAGFNSGVAFIEDSSPPEVWVTNFTNETTTRCEAWGAPLTELYPQQMTYPDGVTASLVELQPFLDLQQIPESPGNIIEQFANFWGTNVVGLAYDPLRGYVRYAHEISPSIYDVAYAPPHSLLGSYSLSGLNPGWPASLDARDGIEYDFTTDTYFMPDFQGDLVTHDDNLIEISPDGIILNAWETDGADNDSYDGAVINSILDIAIVPAYSEQVVISFQVQVEADTCGDTAVNEVLIDDPDMALPPASVSVATEIWDEILLHEDFEGTFPPAGWNLVDNSGSGYVWTDTDPGNRGNLTGGSGKFAIIDDDWAPPSAFVETELWTPPLDIPVCQWNYFRFDTDYHNFSNIDTADVDYSLDGGDSWVNLIHWFYDMSGPFTSETLLPLELSGQTGVIFRFHYNDNGGWNWWWEIDNVQVVGCVKPDVVLTSSDTVGFSWPGEVITYPLTVEYCGPATDNIAITATEFDYPTWADPDTLEMAYGDVVTTTGYMQSWCDAEEGFGTSQLTAECLTSGITDTIYLWAHIVTAPVPENWESIDPLVNPRARSALAAIEGQLYLFGGFLSDGVIEDNVEIYDPVSGHWTSLTSPENLMPHPVTNICTGVIGSDVYIPGGYDASNSFTADLQVFHTTSETWEIIATDPLPLPAAGMGCAVMEEKLYYFGGGEVSPFAPYSAHAYVYDPTAPAEERWSPLPDMNLARGFLTGLAVNGQIYAIGGLDDTGDLPVVEVFNPVANTWYVMTPMDASRGGPGAWLYNNQYIFVCGGPFGVPSNTCEYYDTSQGLWGEWYSLPWSMITPRSMFAYAQLPEGFYAVSGNASGYITEAERLTFEMPPPARTADLTIDAPPLHSVQFPDALNTLQVTLGNSGNCPAVYSVAEMPAGAKFLHRTPYMLAKLPPELSRSFSGSSPIILPGTADTLAAPDLEADVSPVSIASPAQSMVVTPEESQHPEAVLWDQPVSSVSSGAYANQDFETVFDGYDTFIADDFDTGAAFWSIDTIFVPGDMWSCITCTLGDAISLTWQIYADEGGLPADDPYSGGALWNLTRTPDDSDVSITPGVLGNPTNVTLTLDTPLVVSPGHYWLVFYPRLDYLSFGQYGRHIADTTNLDLAQIINPGNSWNFGNMWTPLGDTFTIVQTDAAFRLEGTSYDIPWLSENPNANFILPDRSLQVDVTFDSTGLSVGDYTGMLGIVSNDPDTPTSTLPVTLTVFVNADLSLTKLDDPDPVYVGNTLTYNLAVQNLGPHQATNVVLVDTLPDGVSFVSANHAGCDENVGIVTCNLGNLASGDSIDIAIAVIAPDNVGTITNMAEVSSDIEDPVLANNTASEATTVVMYQSYLPLTSK